MDRTDSGSSSDSAPQNDIHFASSSPFFMSNSEFGFKALFSAGNIRFRVPKGRKR
jgi:hypothetical protein